MARTPNLFIVGAAKAGTSSLYHYLRQHPDIFMCPVKEPHYLCSHHFPARFTGPGDDEFSRNVVRDEKTYLELFAGAGKRPVVGEASVFYIYYPDTARKIHALNPSTKVVAVLRNPVDRAYSAYMHLVRDKRETLPFREALRREDERRRQGYRELWWYREVGLYSRQVKAYLDVFGPDQFRVYLYEDFAQPDRLIRDILNFLEVDPTVPLDTRVRHNASGAPRPRWLYEFLAKPHPVKNALKQVVDPALLHRLAERLKQLTLRRESMDPEVRRELQQFYRDDVLALQDLLGRDLTHWLKD
ncbi:MAG: sulfotransferase [Alicyclobacillaceae bacterium]|nr:sulfotransferase [Alicyclobacillaceae bacterium]